jgi:LPXTG-motif cell wall-anchored protein
VKVNGDTQNTGEFTFNLTATVNGSAVTGTFKLDDGTKTIYFDDEGKATLKILAGSTVTIKDLPIGARVIVKEEGYNGFAPSWHVNSGAETHSDKAEAYVAETPTTIFFVNNTGAVLPSTGGIGTNFFTTMGILMMLVAGVLLLDQRRRLAVSKADPQ